MDKICLTDIIDLMQKSQYIANNACDSKDRAVARASYEAFLRLYQNLIDGGKDRETEH